MKIGIIGSGEVGKALARGFVSRKHQVMVGSRDPAKLKEWAAKEHVQLGSDADAAHYGELVVLATKWEGTHHAIELADPKNFAGKAVIDVTNPLDFSKGTPPTLAVGGNDSGGEQVQRWLPGAHVVKAFNTIGSAHMVDPKFESTPDMFIAGNDEGAKKKVTEILKSFGWNTIDLGGIEGSRYLEPFAMLWITYGFRTNTWNHAFKLMRK